jgi:23S rRNA (guanosine2251-2'-O)-methyltransferase
VDWIYGRQVVRLACADGAKRRPHRLAATAEGLAWLAAHGVGVKGRLATDRGARGAGRDPGDANRGSRDTNRGSRDTSRGSRDTRRGAPAAFGFEVETVTSSDLQQLTGSRDHQGAACLVGDYPYVAPDSLLACELLVVLDEVTDPRNLGAIARSALAAGAGGLVLPRHRSAAVTPAAVKASAGATEHLDIAHVTNVVAFLGQAKQAGAWVYGAEGAAGRPYDALDLGGRVALVFGAEGRGLRPLVRRACDELAAIPMQGPVGSLNVSVAAALFLFEARRQRAAVAPAGQAAPPAQAGCGPSPAGHGPGSSRGA